MGFEPASRPEQDDGQHDNHQYANRPVQQGFVEVDRERRTDQRAEHGGHGEPGTFTDIQRAPPTEGRYGDDVLYEYADPVGTVRHIGRQAEQDQDRECDQRAAAGQRVDEAGNKSNDRNRGEEQDIGVDWCGSSRPALNANSSMRGQPVVRKA
jgi:hypothetical protein